MAPTSSIRDRPVQYLDFDPAVHRLQARPFRTQPQEPYPLFAQVIVQGLSFEAPERNVAGEDKAVRLPVCFQAQHGAKRSLRQHPVRQSLARVEPDPERIRHTVASP
jgi:hypothetical protein